MHAVMISFNSPFPEVTRVSQGVMVVKNQTANAGDMRCWFDPWPGKIPLEKEIATHSSILAWKTPWIE